MTRRQFSIALLVLGASGVVGGALAACLLPSSAAHAQEEIVSECVRARRFEVVDAEGRTRMKMGMDLAGMNGGMVNLSLIGPEGRTRLSLQSWQGNSQVQIWDGSSRQSRVALELDEESNGRLRFRDRTGHVRIGVVQSGVLVMDDQERMRGGMTYSEADDGFHFAAFGATEQVLWTAP